MQQRPNTRPAARHRILIVSDVSLGYGVPQLPALARSLSRYYGEQILVIEPDQLERPPTLADDSEISVERIVTMAHPYSWSGRHEYCDRARTIVEQVKPDLLVISSYYALPTLLNLRHRPQTTILYQVEHLGEHRVELAVTSSVMDRIDIILFTEANRARLDMQRLRLPTRVKCLIVENCAPAPRMFIPASARNGRVFYGGTFHKTRTNARYFLDEGVSQLPIDIYGLIQGFDNPADVTRHLVGADGGAAYMGYVPSGDPFFARLAHYSFSIIMWAPLDEATLHAAPNKFYDAISMGVPPICAPHSVCVDIITRYRCGILLDSWDFESFRAQLTQALMLVGTAEYAQMVDACLTARDRELNWDAQIKRLIPHLPAL